MFFVNNTIRLPGNRRGKACRTVSFIEEINLRSVFVILKSAWDICIQFKPCDSISANQHGIWSIIVYLRPRVISTALQIRNFNPTTGIERDPIKVLIGGLPCMKNARKCAIALADRCPGSLRSI